MPFDMPCIIGRNTKEATERMNSLFMSHFRYSFFFINALQLGVYMSNV